MKRKKIDFNTFKVGHGEKLLLIAGPCVIESKEVLFKVAEELQEIKETLNINVIFKASFDKANRTNINSFRGLGFEKGLEMLGQVKEKFNLPLISDIHEPNQAKMAAKVLDALQVPALLSRQTDLLLACAATGKPVNVKKGQFMAPQDVGQILEKMESEPNFAGLMFCERGFSFGYHNLVVDMRSFPIMAQTGWPIIYDATHSVQLPSASGTQSGGERQFIPGLAKAAVASGIDGLFMETHPSPDCAKCDGSNSWPLNKLKILIKQLLDIHQIVLQQEKLV